MLLAASDTLAQGFSIAPWTFVEPAPTTSGLVVRCERAGEVTGPGGSAIHLRAASQTALQPPNTSQCEIAIEAVTQVTIQTPTRLRVRTLLRGEVHTDAYTQASAFGEVHVGAECGSSTGFPAQPGTQVVMIADSVDICLPPGNIQILVRFRASSTVNFVYAYNTVAWSDFYSGDGGFVVELVDAGSCTTEPPPVVPPHFGVFADAAGTRCNIPAPLFQLGSMYVLARGGSGCALSGAEFRVDGFPPEWQSWIYPNSEAYVSIGNPIAGGCNIAFSTCQSSTREPTLLYRIDFLPTTTVSNRPLSIERHSSPSCPGFCCVWWVLCDPPVYTKICVPSMTSVLNGTTDPCTTNVETTSWSAVKGLYRR